MQKDLALAIKQILVSMKIVDIDPQVERPMDLSHGDYTTNVAMILARRLKKNPLEIAKEIVKKFTVHSSQLTAKVHNQTSDQSGQNGSPRGNYYNVLQDIEKVEVVPPGFINFHLALSSLNNYMERVLTLVSSKSGSGLKGTKGLTLNLLSETHNLQPTTHNHPRQRIMVEFAHPNTHKAFHIGHLRNITTGESIVRLLEAVGHKVIRANYQGDVGMHIAKAIYALLQIKSGSGLEGVKGLTLNQKIEFLGKMYAAGSKAFEDPSADGKEAQSIIKDINYLIYAAVQRFNSERGIEPSSTDYMKFVTGRAVEVDEVYELWKETRQWSLDYFASIYNRVDTTYQRFYFESECLSGVDRAKDAVKKGILEESEGAIIFNGKKYGLDTRVFVNSLGLPTYEGKELALAKTQFVEFGKLDKLIHVLGPEQVSFTQVTFKVEELLGIQKDQQLHLVYGWVKLKHGKMSSRSGNVVLGEWLIDEAKKEIYHILDKSKSKDIQTGSDIDSGLSLESGSGLKDPKGLTLSPLNRDEVAEKAAIAAVKYSFLKVSTKQEISFDLEESVSFEGDSGPYIQYTYARCKSVIRKAEGLGSGLKGAKGLTLKQIPGQAGNDNLTLNPEEILVLRKLYQFPEVVLHAANQYAPNVLCEYLYDLASLFNTFYNKHTILGKNQGSGLKGAEGLTPMSVNFRLSLTSATAETLKHGLYLLGIATLERM